LKLAHQFSKEKRPLLLQIGHALNMLKETGALVDSRCGLHVHIGVLPGFELPHFKNLPFTPTEFGGFL